MALSTIRSVPNTPEELADWVFAHASFHRDTVRAVYETLGVQIPEYVLNPVNMADPVALGAWLNLHQEMHTTQNNALSIQGYDLNDLDWNDPPAVIDWFSKHADEHMRVGAILNLS